MTNTDLRPPAAGDVVAPDPPAGGYTPDEALEEPAPWKPVSFPALRFAALMAVLVAVGVLYPWVLIVILCLIFMIFMHELGHFVMARRADMKVTEFFIGFGPRIWSFKRGEVEYGLKVLPLGAYVKIIGMTNLEEVAPEDEARTYRQKTFGQRVKVAVAGSTMHFLMALVLIFILLTVVGVPGGRIAMDPENWRVGQVHKGSAAADAGLQQGDRIIAVNGKDVGTFESMKDIVVPLKGKTVVVTYERDGRTIERSTKLRDFTVTLDGQTQTSCCLGLGQYQPPKETVGPVAAVPLTIAGFADIVKLSVTGFVKIFSPSGISNFAGQVADAGDEQPAPAKSGSSSSSSTTATKSQDLENRPVSIIGIVNLGSQAGSNAASGLIAFFALVNIFIGLFNLIPLLPFDGGHVAVAVYEKIQEKRLRRKRYFVDAAKLLPLTYVVVGLLGVLFLSTVYLDILNPIQT